MAVGVRHAAGFPRARPECGYNIRMGGALTGHWQDSGGGWSKTAGA